MKQVTTRELGGEIWAEICMACMHGPIEGFEFIDTEKIRDMDRADFEALGHIIDLIVAVLDRHVEKIIAADPGREPRPLPHRFPEDA